MSDSMWLETWDEMQKRHDLEKYNVLKTLSDRGYTQTEAASILKKPVQFINTYVNRYGIRWKVKAQGVRTNATRFE